MPQYTRPIQNVIDGFSSLPGIGSRSAERIAFHLLKLPTDEALRLARAVEELKTRVTHCRVCSNLAEKQNDDERPLCDICDDGRRDRTLVCVVEQPKDLLALESTGLWNGLYHVLLGRIAPLDGIDPEDLTLRDLEARLVDGEIKEIVLGTNPNLDGDATSLYIQEMVRTRHPDVRVTRLARGLASGTQIEYANRSVLEDAIRGRQTL